MDINKEFQKLCNENKGKDFYMWADEWFYYLNFHTEHENYLMRVSFDMLIEWYLHREERAIEEMHKRYFQTTKR